MENASNCRPETKELEVDPLLGFDNEFRQMEIVSSTTDTIVPSSSDSSLASTSSDSDSNLISNLMNKAQVAYDDELFGRAADLYTILMERNPSAELYAHLLGCRAEALFNLGCVESSLKDCEKVLEMTPHQEMVPCTYLKCLWDLKRFDEAARFLQGRFPQDLITGQLYNYFATQRPKFEMETNGQYDIRDLVHIPPDMRVHIGNYKGPVEICEILGKGRGLIANEKLSPGTVICGARAFAISFGLKKIQNPALRHKDNVILSIFRKIHYEPKTGEEYFKLFPGPEIESSREDKKLEKYATKLLEEESNILGLKWNDDIKKEKILQIKEITKRFNFNHITSVTGSVGIWILPSYLNHTCVDANALWFVYGDFLIIRALREIQPGEEITISYGFPGKVEVHEVVEFTPLCETVFSTRKFVCECRLCLLKKTKEYQTNLVREEELKKGITKKIGRKDPKTLELHVKVFRKLVKLGESYDRINVNLYDNTWITILGNIMETQQYHLAAEVYEEFWKISANLLIMPLVFSMVVLTSYLKLEKVEQVRKWSIIVNADLAIGFGPEVAQMDEFELQKLIADSHISTLDVEQLPAVAHILVRTRSEV